MKTGGNILISAVAVLMPLWAGCANLHKAAGSGDLDVVDRCLRQGVDVNARDEYGRTPLMWAAEDPDMVRRLVEQGADVNARDENGETPLMYAAFVNRLDVLRHLVEQGADVNARSEGGGTPLMWAAADLAAARYLVEQGAEVNARDDHGETPISWALVFDHQDIVRYLESHGAAQQRARAPVETPQLFAGDLSASVPGPLAEERR